MNAQQIKAQEVTSKFAGVGFYSSNAWPGKIEIHFEGGNTRQRIDRRNQVGYALHDAGVDVRLSKCMNDGVGVLIVA